MFTSLYIVDVDRGGKYMIQREKELTFAPEPRFCKAKQNLEKQNRMRSL